MRKILIIEKVPSWQGPGSETQKLENRDTLFSNGAHTHKQWPRTTKFLTSGVKTNVEGTVSHFFEFLLLTISTGIYFQNSEFCPQKTVFWTSSLHSSGTKAKIKILRYCSLRNHVEKITSKFHQNPSLFEATILVWRWPPRSKSQTQEMGIKCPVHTVVVVLALIS